MADKTYFNGYFKKIDHNGLKVTDLSQRSVFLRNVKNNAAAVGDYQIRDGETSWSLAYDFYGDEDYYWLILHLNDIIDPFFGWPLTQFELDKFTTLKYGSAKYDVHHWLLDDRIYNTDPGHPESFSISNHEHEEILNEEKRHIRILRPEYLGKAIKEFERSMK